MTIYIIVALVAGFAVVGTVNAARFELSPSSGAFRAECNSVINIMMSTESRESDAANILISYDPTEIEIIDANDTLAGVQINEGSVYDIYIDNIAEPTGEIRLTGFSIGHPYDSGSGFGNFGAIQFRSFFGVGSTSLTIDYVPGSTLDSNIAEYITSDDLLSGVTDGSYTFEIGPCFDDITPPWVSEPRPSPGSTDNPLDSDITFRIRDNQSGVDITTLAIEVQGILYTFDGINRFSYSGDSMDYYITVDPIEDFIEGVIVRVEVDAEDFDNNVMPSYRWFFNQPAEPPPVPPTCEELGCPSPEDCPTPEEIPECIEPEVLDIPEPTVGPGEELARGVIKFFASNRTVQLMPSTDSVVKTLVNTPYTVLVNRTDLEKPVENIWWYSGSSSYLMGLDSSGDFYSTDVMSKTNITVLPSHVIVNYTDGSIDVVDYRMQTTPFGYIYELDEGERNSVSGARVTVYEGGTNEPWNADAYGQSNPFWTLEDGSYGYYVPQGNYYVTVEKPGYSQSITPMYFVRSGILNDQVELFLIPEPQNIIDELEQSSNFVGETILDVAKRIQNAIAGIIPGTEEQFKEVASIAAPAAIGLALLNLGTAVSFANVFPFLYGLFTQPLLLFGRRKRKKWGVVYNSLNKLAIDLAVVRLIEAQTGRVVRTRITDKDGRYFFMAKPGIYRIEVKKPGFLFPTVHLRDAKEDFQYLDVYHGEIIQVKEASRQITANIPIDPIAATEKPKGIIVRHYMRQAQKFISTSSVFLALALVIISPSWWLLGNLFIQLLLLGLFWRLARPTKPKGWGIVYDNRSKKPLPNAIVRIFDSQYNKLLETQVTDSQGKYSFLVGNNRYYTTYDKPGFISKKLSPIDYTKIKEKSMVAFDVGLDKAKFSKFDEKDSAVEKLSVKVGQDSSHSGANWQEEGEGIKPPSSSSQ